MSKTYTVDLPVTQSRVLKYTRAERMEFEKRCRHFGLAGMKEILYKRVFPIEPDPNRDNQPTPTGGGDLEAQILIVYLGLRHIDPKRITEERVAEWIDTAIQEDRPMLPIVATAVNAVMASGILGYKFNGFVEEEEAAPATEGKAVEATA